MADEYFLDYEGADSASVRFGNRATDLAGGASEVMPEFTWADLPVMFNAALTTAGTLERAFSGRMFAYSDQLRAMSKHVDGAVRVTNDVDVDLTLAP